MSAIYIKILVFICLFLGGGYATERLLKDKSFSRRIVAHSSALFMIVVALASLTPIFEGLSRFFESDDLEPARFEMERNEHQSTSELIQVEGRSKKVSEVKSPNYVVDDRPWITLNRGQRSDNFEFTTDGQLLYSGQLLSHNIPVTGIIGENRWIYAQSLVISPVSPNEEFVVFYGCELKNVKGMCWSRYIARLSNLQVEKMSAGLKYGINNWIAWFTDYSDENAIVRSGDHYFRVHLPTATSSECSLYECATRQ